MWSTSPSKSAHLIPMASEIRSPLTARNRISVEYGSSSLLAMAIVSSGLRIVRLILLPACGSFTPAQGFFSSHPQVTAQERTRLIETRIPRRVLRQYRCARSARRLDFLSWCSATPDNPWTTREYFEIRTIALIATLCRVAGQKVVLGGGSSGKSAAPLVGQTKLRRTPCMLAFGN